MGERHPDIFRRDLGLVRETATWTPRGIDCIAKAIADTHSTNQLMKGADSEAAEQLMRWLSRFKLMVNHMGVGEATLFMGSMMWAHAERAISEGCEDTHKMSDEQLGEARAAFDVQPYGDTGGAARTQLAARLLAGTHEAFSARVQEWRREVAVQRAAAAMRRATAGGAGSSGARW